AGNVVSQSPEGGALVQPGTDVDLVVSSGPCPVAVPDVTGMMQSEAEQSIVSAGLAVGEVTQACSDTVPAGNVASQSPEGGAMVQPGTAVDLVVSTGQPTVPDVTGLAEPDALSAILAVPGLGVSVTLQCSDTVAAGLVAGQSVSGGTVAACGTVVILTVSTGVCPVAVPDVTGLTLEAAGLALEQASLLYTTLEDCSDTTPAGSVAAQAPEPGSLVPPASTVALVVSTGPCPVTVPNVLGLEEDAALAALREASLLYEVLQDCSDTVPAGQVAAQDPAGGAVVPPGTTVTVTVSVGMCVTVPDVTGLPVLNAALQLDEAGLTLGTRTDDCDGSVPQGQVRAQDPAAGSRVLAGTAVNISVSTGPCPPDNDLCENAYPLITGVETYGNLFNATPTEGVSWDFADIYDVWYSWTPETSGNAVITTCGPGTTFDTVLRVFDNCNDLTQLTSNEDSDQCDENPTHSRLTYPVTAGNTYLIRVSGYAQTVGQFQVQAYMEGGL
ncbi:MAG TPA: PASTA domain-containing protein, partial [Candidatus Hydrogenedentes bacterium]|nr:PASTA domain-containing protein [Candidatus Hydrogenedentota bacterium]